MLFINCVSVSASYWKAAGTHWTEQTFSLEVLEVLLQWVLGKLQEWRALGRRPEEASLFHRCSFHLVPTTIYIPHRLPHQRIHVSVPWPTMPLHMYTQRELQKEQTFTALGDKAFSFFDGLMTCSNISSFHHSSKHPGSLHPACNNTEPRGIFIGL